MSNNEESIRDESENEEKPHESEKGNQRDKSEDENM